MADLSARAQAVLDAAYDQLVSAYASAWLAAPEGATPENVATFARYAQVAYDLIAGVSPTTENPAVTLLMMAPQAERRALNLVTVGASEDPDDRR